MFQPFERFTSANDYTVGLGYSGGFPNFHQADHGQGIVMGTHLLPATAVSWQDVPRSDLNGASRSDIPELFRQVAEWCGRNGAAATPPVAKTHRTSYPIRRTAVGKKAAPSRAICESKLPDGSSLVGTGQAQSRYQQAQANGRGDFRKLASAQNSYRRALTSTKNSYERALASARNSYERARTSAQNGYRRALVSARESYQRAESGSISRFFLPRPT